jgi:hypothetical protein
MKTKTCFTIVVLFTALTVLVTPPAQAQQVEGSPLVDRFAVTLFGVEFGKFV